MQGEPRYWAMAAAVQPSSLVTGPELSCEVYGGDSGASRRRFLRLICILICCLFVALLLVDRVKFNFPSFNFQVQFLVRAAGGVTCFADDYWVIMCFGEVLA